MVSFQIIQKKNLNILIQYVALEKKEIKDRFYKEISKEFSLIKKDQFDFEQVNDISKTIAGKHKWIVKEK